MFLNKKGIVPHLLLVFTLLTMGVALFLFSSAMENQKDNIGFIQQDTVNLLFEGREDLNYDKNVLKQEFSDVLIRFADNGGVYHGSASSGYTYWKKGEFECYPTVDSLKKSFLLFLDEGLSSDIQGSYDFDLIFENNGMSVVMESNGDYSAEKEKYKISYSPGYETSVFYDYNFNSFLDGVDEVQRVISLCGDDSTCWEKEATFDWVKDNNLYKVEITSSKLIDAFGEKEVVLKAAIDFDEVNPLVDGELKCLA